MMRDRLEVLRSLLRDDGFLCCHIDDSEGHYIKVLLDEIFGRANYLTTIYIQVRYPTKTLKQNMDFHKEIEYIHVYRKEYGAEPNLPRKSVTFDKFKHYIEETGSGKTITLGGKTVTVFGKDDYRIKSGEGSAIGLKEIWASGTILDGNSSGRFFRDYLAGRVSDDGLGVLYKVSGIGDDQFPYRYFTGPKREGATKGKYFQGVPMEQLNRKEGDEDPTIPIENFYDLAGSFGNCRHEGGVEFRSGKKPEALLKPIIGYFSNVGDIVLDSFAGSGSTGAVAHKMRRRWIMVELREQCDSHVAPRLMSVINGTDETGVTKDCSWQGGGGFRYFSIAPSLLQEDEFGNWIINKKYNPEMLAEALCKLEGFTYAPSRDYYWQHGYSTETDFIYVTTQTLTREQLVKLSDEVGHKRSLLICCGAFRVRKLDDFPNLTLKKIPHAVMSKCEWGKDDYSLEIKALPDAPESEPDELDEFTAGLPKYKRKARKALAEDMPLFGSEDDQ